MGHPRRWLCRRVKPQRHARSVILKPGKACADHLLQCVSTRHPQTCSTLVPMKRSDYISSSLSVIAIVISLFVWRTADTRASELREKIIKYSVDSGGGGGSSSFDDKPRVHFDVDSTIVEVAIANDGSLPVSGVTLSISTNGFEHEGFKPEVTLMPAVDREIVEQGSVLVVRLKNPLGPKEHVSASVVFYKAIPAKEFVSDFKLEQAYVDSEVGAGVLVASLSKKQISFSDKP